MHSILVFNVGSSSMSVSRYVAASLELIHTTKFFFPNPLTTQAEFLQWWRASVRDHGGLADIQGIGHRVVHGGNDFVKTTLISDDNLPRLRALCLLAPLHNPWNVAGIEACLTYFPGIPNVAVFDTAFFSTLPPEATTYALPQVYHHYRRYGFHGISHAASAEMLTKKLNKPLKKLTFISCHLGGGSSLALHARGFPLATTMGFSPLEGLVMVSRPGDTDMGILFDIMRNVLARCPNINEAREALAGVENAFYTSAGLKGLSGCTSYLELLDKMKRGDTGAILAFRLFVRSIKKYIGAFCALAPKLDALVFTGSIGAGDPITRQTVLQGLSCVKGVTIYTFTPQEELFIAREVKKMVDVS